ncbi:MAG TPA: LysR family transcriptional regulator [Candidatus Eisenbergiella intestinipullorum]|nr:LysR family transcriptional regulator [Candidatus Eisenbergiella intestinipullorum]
MELRVLQYFLAVAREQNITAAAESLHLSQPTLSTQLKALEEELGKQLLIRGTKGSRKVTLTQEGMILRKRAEEILDLVQKTENEISLSDDVVAGDIYIGTGETNTIRLFARAAGKLQRSCPHIHYHIFSGNSAYVLEMLDKGLVDFGLLYSSVDLSKYDTLNVPVRDVWGVLMRRDSPLAKKEAIRPEDLWDLPLIVSHQENARPLLSSWLKKDLSELNVVATYNLVLNASMLTDEGFGYTICYDRLLDTENSPSLCFRPLSPPLEAEATIIWKKYQVFSRAAEAFLEQLKKTFRQQEND